jgi:hypothetical protein
MPLPLAVLIVVGVTALAIGGMLAVRRISPDGGWFNDGDRAAGVFGVLATGFAVLLGFIVFLAFTSYDASRTGAEEEALIVAQQIETAQLLPDEASGDLTVELVCYARSVAGVQWDRMEAGHPSDLNPWGAALYETFSTVEPGSASEEAAYSTWIDQTFAREAARVDRIHGAAGVIPSPLWFVLFLTSAVILVYMLFFADRGERAIVQALLMGTVVSVMAMLLVLLQFLDNPFHGGVGSLQPIAMERTLTVIDEELGLVDFDRDLPCDERGNPL